MIQKFFNQNKIIILCMLIGTTILAAPLFKKIYFHTISKQQSDTQKVYPQDISMITYGLSGSRFGDGVVCYMHAKWLSYRYDIPLLYTPFPQSEYLCIADMETKPETRPLESFKEIVQLSSRATFERLKNHRKEKGILYVIPYYSDYEGECNNAFFKQFFTIDWRNKEFRDLLRTHVASHAVMPKPILYPNMINVALHLRTGRGFDNLAKPGEDFKKAMKGEKNFCNMYFPFKLPAMNFFSNALHQLCLIFDNKPIHVHIFTDDPHPEDVLETLKKQMEQKKHSCALEYTYNKTSQNDLDIIEDFFTLTYFDCLIRPASNFSFCAAKICDFLIEICPKSLVATDEFFFINKFHVQYRNGETFDITIPVER